MGVLWPNGSNLETFQQGLKFGNGNEITTVNNIPEYNGQNLLDGSYDTYLQENFSVTRAADLASGNNATPFGGGLLAGALTDNTVTPISGVSTLVYTQAAGSVNDYFFLPNKTIELKQAGNTSGLTEYIKYSGDVGDLKAIVWDVTNGDVLTSDLDLVPSASNPTRFILGNGFHIPEGVTEIAVGFQVVNETIGAVLEVDDIELSTDPFRNGVLTKTQTITYTGFISRSGVNVRLKTEKFNSGGGLVSVDNTIETKYIFNSPSKFTTVNNYYGGANSSQIIWYDKDDVEKLRTIEDNGSGVGSSSLIGEAEEGDYLISTASGNPDDNAFHNFSVKATAQDSAVITPVTSSETVTNVLTASAASTGVVSDLTFTGVTIGNSYLLNFPYYGFASGGNAKVEIDILSGVDIVGYVLIDTSNNDTASTETSTSYSKVIVATSDTLTFNITSLSGGGQLLGDGTFGRTHAQLTNMTAQFLAAVPRNKVAILSETQSSGTEGGSFTPINTYLTRTLNTLEGDTELIELVSDQFRYRQEGIYLMKAKAPAYGVNSHKARIENVTTSEVFIGRSAYSQSGVTGQTDSIVTVLLTVTDTSHLFELQHLCKLVSNTYGLGNATSSSDNERYSEVTITKLR